MKKKNYNNKNGQSIGESVEDWQGCSAPPKTKMEGRHCVIEILDIIVTSPYGADILKHSQFISE